MHNGISLFKQEKPSEFYLLATADFFFVIERGCVFVFIIWNGCDCLQNASDAFFIDNR